MSREAMQQALDALEKGETKLRWAAISALKQALAEPEQRAVSLNNGRLTQYPDGSIGVGTPAEPRPIQECYGDCPTDPATCLNPCNFEGRPKPGQKPQTTHWEGCEAVHPECRKPEQEPVAWMWLLDGEVWDLCSTKDRFTPMRDGHVQVPLYTAPTPQREHITDGSPCWCNPDVIEEDGGNVIVHNYDDNWQQYAKPGETAQQCIERHRGEQDALMKLYATPRKPLTDEQCDSILLALDEWARRFDHYEYGLPLYNEELRGKAREVMRIAHGITGETK